MKKNATTRILILCTGNSCRSQMAEAIVRSFDPSFEVHSAGTAPAHRVQPNALKVLAEIGIVHAEARPKSVNEFLQQSFDYVITVCDHARETCPVFQGRVAKQMHMGFDDPSQMIGSDEEILRAYRRVRDEMLRRFRELYDTELKSFRR